MSLPSPVPRRRARWVGLGLASALALGAYPTARALDFGSAIKLFGVGFAVKQFGGQINSFLNTILAQKGAATKDATKVVPIISIGKGGYIGAAQVMGPEATLSTVKAVGQGELGFGGSTFRLKALIPINTTNPTKGMKRVSGVGVSAIIDLKL